MASLENNYISRTFNSLLKLMTNSSFTGNTQQTISDGVGNSLPMLISPNIVEFTTTVKADSIIIGNNTGITDNTIYTENISIKGKVFDNLGLSGETNQVLSRGVNGLRWSSPNIMLSGSALTFESFSEYTATTQNQINGKVDTNVFVNYTGITENKINSKLDISTFANYSGNTQSSITLFSSGSTLGSTVRVNNGNLANGTFSTVSGGQSNTASGSCSFISGGANNKITNLLSGIGGGTGNEITSMFGTISGGYKNRVTGTQSIILGGLCNTVSGNYSFVGGGCYNTVSSNNTYVLGSNITGSTPNMTYVQCLSITSLPTSDPGISGVVWRNGINLMISTGTT